MTSLDRKRFRVLRNDGPGAEVTGETVFEYRQEGSLVHAVYGGGRVALGRLVGVIDGDALEQAYVQVNTAGEIRSGKSTIAIRRSQGRIQLVDEWQWDGGGSGICILEEWSPGDG